MILTPIFISMSLWLLIIILHTEILSQKLVQTNLKTFKWRCFITLCHGFMGIASGFIIVTWWDYNYEWHVSIFNWVYGSFFFLVSAILIKYGPVWLKQITKPKSKG